MWNPRGCLLYKQKLTDQVLFNRWKKNVMSKAGAWAWGRAHSGPSYWVSKSGFCSHCPGSSLWVSRTHQWATHRLQEGCIWPGGLSILLGHLESQLPALPTHWNSPRKPHQPFIGRQPGMIKEMSLKKPVLAGIFSGTALFNKYFLQKRALRQESHFFL